MTSTSKRFIIILVVIAAFAAAGYWIWTTSQGPVSSLDASSQTVNQNLNTPPKPVVDPNGNVSYPVPRVFPVNTSFDTNVLNSSDFKALVPYVPVIITSAELGRDDPFKNY